METLKDWSNCEMEQIQFENLKRKVLELKCKYSIKDLVAEVHNLFQDYLISEEQEAELYSIVDPEEKENSPAELWFNDYGCAELYDFLWRNIDGQRL